MNFVKIFKLKIDDILNIFMFLKFSSNNTSNSKINIDIINKNYREEIYYLDYIESLYIQFFNVFLFT